MTIDQIAIQFYTLRDHLKTPKDFAESCRKVAAIGYRAVQISGVDYRAIPPANIARICADHGLTICATHEDGNTILECPQQVIDTLGAMGANLTAYPYPAGFDLSSEESVATLISKLDAAGATLAAAGITLTYHNHHHEFQKLNGRIILELLYDSTSPGHLQGEPDTYWIQYGGGNPVAWCKRLAGRLPIIHLKDYRINAQATPEFCEVGQGNLDIPAIIAEAELAGCQWFTVEQDTCPGDPFDSIRASFDFLATLAN